MASQPKTPVTFKDDLGVRRCWWCGEDQRYIEYHDKEWGVPVANDQRLFEKLCLEGFQAGLSWITVLRKRPAFRESFCDFDFTRVAKFTPAKVNRLLENEQIIRHRGKIQSAINNAGRALEMVERYGSIAAFLWQFEPDHSPTLRTRSQIQATTPESVAMSKALKKAGWTFLGPTTCYALMQAMGMVNDHLHSCYRWQEVNALRDSFKRPRID